MKKILSAALICMMLMTLATSAMAATGMGIITTVSATSATAEKNGSVSLTSIICAVTLDDEGKIAAVRFDNVQSEVKFDTAGVVAEFDAAPVTKIELGDAYNMKVGSPIGKEWYEQIAHLENWCVGKTVEEVVTGAMADADVKAGCTFYFGGELQALEKAAQNAK